MYFGRGLHSEDNDNGARASQFTGQTSISSNQYFGRGEEEEGPSGSHHAHHHDSNGGSLSPFVIKMNQEAYKRESKDPLASIGREAQDFARSFVSQAKQDINTVKHIAEAGTQKVSFSYFSCNVHH